MSKSKIINILLIFLVLLIVYRNDEKVVASSMLVTASENVKITNYREVPIENNKKDLTISTVSTTTSDKRERDDKDVLNKFFKTNKEKEDIKTIIDDLKNDNIEKVYNDIKNRKYINSFNSFINNNEKLINKFRDEFIKDKYNDYYKKLFDFINNDRYYNIRTEIVKVIDKHKDETDEIIKLYKKLDLKILLTNFNTGKYSNLIKDFNSIILKEEYNDIVYEFINEIVDGEFTDMFYDVIYTSLEIIYKYDEDSIILNETTEIKVETTEIIQIEDEKEKKEKGLSLILIVFPVLLTLTIIMLLVGYILSKRDEGGE